MSNERSVQLSGVQQERAPGLLHTEGQLQTTAGNVSDSIPKFHEVKLKNFRARHAVVDDNIVIHFYLPVSEEELKRADPRAVALWETWWLEKFPLVLSPVAQDYFSATIPRLVAKYTEEEASWWFRASGFGATMNPRRLAELFLERLDAQLSESASS